MELQHQQPFGEHANLVKDFLSSGDVVVAHNASFDLSFIDREYLDLGEKLTLPCYCTMSGYRQSGATGRASLNAICNEIGLKRIGEKHGALEDAWLALMVYFWLNRAPSVRPTAILMLEVARASDSLAAEEIDILVDLIQSVRTRLGIPADNEVEFEVLADIFEINLTQNQLTRSARAVYEDEGARADFPKWFSDIATADGDVSDAEQAAIQRVKSAIKRVLPK